MKACSSTLFPHYFPGKARAPGTAPGSKAHHQTINTSSLQRSRVPRHPTAASATPSRVTAPLEPAFLRGDIGVRKNKRIFLAAPLPLFVPWKESASCQRCYRSQPGQVSKAWSSVRPPAYCSSPLCPLFQPSPNARRCLNLCTHGSQSGAGLCWRKKCSKLIHARGRVPSSSPVAWRGAQCQGLRASLAGDCRVAFSTPGSTFSFHTGPCLFRI